MTRIYQPSDWCWISLIGPDAQDFLHRVTTVHARALQPGQGTPGFFLNPQGKVRASFNLWCYREAEYAFEFAAGQGGKWKTELLAAIDQYTFAEKMTLADVTGLECRWILADAPGTEIVFKDIELKAGEKIVKFAKELFAGSAQATGKTYQYVRFESASPTFAAIALGVEGDRLTSFPVEILR
jgi:folate-binding Fe-S cluster repair protein YgfZ